MNLLVIFIGLIIAAYSAYGLAWTRKGGKKSYDEIVGRGGIALKVRAFQIRLTVIMTVGLVIFVVGFVAPPWP